ncbi:MAG: hypothetical protein WC666_02350 [Candidatus Paceibacterota bacterium]|jgi:hypothetical protein
MNIPESPYQRLIDIIDLILVKNETVQGGSISLHVLELPALPQNSLGNQILVDTLKTLKQKQLIATFSGVSQYRIPKLDAEAEKKLTSERQNLFNRISTARPDHANVYLKDETVSFNDEQSIIQIGKKTCALPPFKNEHYFCQAMFSHLPNEPVDWSLIYKQMNGNHADIADEKHKRTIQDTMYALNNRIKKTVNTDDALFTWENRTVKRNF